MSDVQPFPAPDEGSSTTDFGEFFCQTEQGRGAFLSRLFGLFSEDVVRYWCQCSPAAYANLGRPTLRDKTISQHAPVTLDFTLQHRLTKQTFVTEMKCELQFENYRHLRLTNTQQLEHHIRAPSDAFRWFLRAASTPKEFEVRIDGKPVMVDGAILIWGAISARGRDDVMAKYGIADVLSIEAMLGDLREWQPAEWTQRVSQLRRWASGLFDFLS